MVFLLQVTFAELNKRDKKFVIGMSESTRSILNNEMKGDNLLYQYFLEKHKRKVEEYGYERMKQKVIQLKILNSKIQEKCVSKSLDNNETLIENISLTNNVQLAKGKDLIKNVQVVNGLQWCQPFFEKEPDFLRKIRDMNKALLGQFKKIL